MTQATNRPATIRMWPSKKLVDPFDMDASDVRLADIAHSLARICRYTGAVEGFISVAEHSITVARMLQADGEPIGVVRAGLLHDASEAYLGRSDIKSVSIGELPLHRLRAQRSGAGVVCGVFSGLFGWSDRGPGATEPQLG